VAASREGNDASRILLTAVDNAKGPSYEIFVVCDNDLLTAMPYLAQLEGRNLISSYDLNTWSEKDFASTSSKAARSTSRTASRHCRNWNPSNSSSFSRRWPAFWSSNRNRQSRALWQRIRSSSANA